MKSYYTRRGQSRYRQSVRRGQRRRFRVVNRRRFIAAQAALIVIALGALGLSASVIWRSIRTARLNRTLAAMHTADGQAPTVEVAAPPAADMATLPAREAGEMQLARMGMPDGSPIVESSIAVTTPGRWHNTSGDVLPDMLKLLNRNPDTVGWLYIKGIVSLPVVYRDNTFYLTHDFSGAKNKSGALFLDAGHPLDAGAQNLLIYGHAMFDGSMFGLLTHYKEPETAKAHPLIDFSSLYEKESYAVFAVLKTSPKAGDADYFDYFTHPAFVSDADFTDYIEQVRARALYEIPVSVAPGDALLTLSTCLDDDRLVVFARKLHADESRDEIISSVTA